MSDMQAVFKAVNRYLTERYPKAVCGLEFSGDPYKLLVAAILSAQCTDTRVNQVCTVFFRRWDTLNKLAAADVSDIAEIIRSVGLYNAKAKNLKLCAVKLVDDFHGVIPSDMDELLTLPGVGRKIANLIRGDFFSLGGIVADTHMIRICKRLGFTEKSDPLITEKKMSILVPTDEQSDFCHRVVMFGRDICTARSPKCSICQLKGFCTFNP